VDAQRLGQLVTGELLGDAQTAMASASVSCRMIEQKAPECTIVYQAAFRVNTKAYGSQAAAR